VAFNEEVRVDRFPTGQNLVVEAWKLFDEVVAAEARGLTDFPQGKTSS